MASSRRSTWSVFVAPVLVIAVLVLTGCSGGAPAPHASENATQLPIGSISTVTTQQQVVRPIDTYMPTASEILKLISIETQKVNACLTKSSLPANYAYADPAQLAPAVADAVASNVTRNELWGFFDSNAADYSRYGYAGSPETQSPIQIDGGGTSPKCVNQADAGLPGHGMALSLTDTTSLPGGGPQTPSNDTRWVDAQSKWSTCMAQAGFHYKTPLDAINDPQWGTGPASSLQIATATADIQCKVKTNLVGIGLAIQTAYDQQYIQKNQQALNKYRAEITAYLAQS